MAGILRVTISFLPGVPDLHDVHYVLRLKRDSSGQVTLTFGAGSATRALGCPGVTRIVDFRSAFPYFRESPPELRAWVSSVYPVVDLFEFLWCLDNHEEKLERRLW